jgi:hypothetical protein
MPITNSPLTGVTLTATSGTSPDIIGTQTIPLSSLSLGANTVQITPGSTILTALQSGATVTPSLNLEYANGLQVVSVTGTSYPPRTTEKIISVTVGPIIRGFPTALMRFSTANGRNAVGDTSIVGIIDGLSVMLGIHGQVVADPDNTILSSFFTATIMFGGHTLPTFITSLSVKSSMYSTVYSTITNVTL